MKTPGQKHNLRIAFLDIENAPNLAWVWDYYEQNVIDVNTEWQLLSFSVRWEGESKVHTYALPDFKGYAKDKMNDRALAWELWKVFDEADVIIAHNGDRHDIRKAHARFIAHGFGPTSPFRTIDTLKIARRHFKFNSNKLSYIAKFLGLGSKVQHTGWELWSKCISGDPAAWSLMRKYNAQDVVLLEKVYRKLLPWHLNVPTLTPLKLRRMLSV